MAARKKVTLVARETFTTEVDGERVVVHAGQTAASSSALVKGREQLFAPAEQPDHEAAKPR